MSVTAPDVRLPREIFYDSKPLATEASQETRTYLTVNGGSFRHDGSNVARVLISAGGTSLLNGQASFLQYTIKNVSAEAADGLALSQGVSWCQSVRITSGGQVLEQTDNFNRYTAALNVCQQSPSQLRCQGSFYGGAGTRQAAGSAYPVEAPAAGTPQLGVMEGPLYSQVAAPILQNEERTFATPLHMGIFNSSKYYPLCLDNNGLEISFTLAPPAALGANCLADGSGAAGTGVQNTVGIAYEITDVRMVCSIVNVSTSVVDQLKAELAMSGSLTMATETCTAYQDSIAATESSISLNIPCKSRSINNIMSTVCGTAAKTTLGTFSTDVFQRQDITEWSYMLAGARSPSLPVSFRERTVAGSPNRAGDVSSTACHALKAWGTLGDAALSTCMNRDTLGADVEGQRALKTCVVTDADAGFMLNDCTVFAQDLKSFSLSMLEAGYDSQTFASALSFEATRNGNANQVACDVVHFVSSDLLIYISPDGQVTASR